MPPNPKPAQVSLSVWLVLAGAAAGLATGLLVGDYAAVLKPVGNVYAMLLEVAVYPYLICSLIHGLGSMTPANAWRLFRTGWVFYVALWVLTFALLIVFAMGIPPAQPLSFTPEGSASTGPSLVEMLIPSDPFTALSRNYVPAVILFCIAFGISLQHVQEKQSLLAVLESVRLTSLAFWSGVVRFAPLAVFAIFAGEAGTLRIAELESIAVYLLLFFGGAFALAFWIVPACLAALTPLRATETLREIRSAFAISLVTTLSVAALPFISAATQRLVDRCGIDDPERGEIVRTNLSIAYPLGQLGNFFVFLFIVFVASLHGVVPQTSQAWLLPSVSLVSCIGSPTSSVDAVTFLAGWLGLPQNTSALYVGLMALTRYGQVIASVAGFAFLSFTVVLAYYGKIRWRPLPLAGTVVAAGLLAAGLAAGGRSLASQMAGHRQNPYLDFTLDSELANAISHRSTPPDDVVDESVMSRIQRTGELRVGVNDSIIPFCYRNAAGQLVGYDVALACRLATDLNVTVRFVPFEWKTLEADLIARRFDIAMAGIYVTADRLVKLEASDPYFQSPLAFFMPRARVPDFRSREEISARPDVRIGVFDDPVLLPRLGRTFPHARIVVVPDYSEPPDFGTIDAAVWTLVQAEAMAAAHPSLAAVEPSDAGDPYLFAYFMPPGSDEFVGFVNYWLQLKRSEGFLDRQHAYWIRRQPRTATAPRWSILHNVLGIGKK